MESRGFGVPIMANDQPSGPPFLTVGVVQGIVRYGTGTEVLAYFPMVV